MFATQSWSARVEVSTRGQELLSRHRLKELEKNLKELDIIVKDYEKSLVLIDFGIFSLFFWPRRGCYMASSREYDPKSVPELHENQDESNKFGNINATSSDCKCLVWEKWVGRCTFSAQGTLLETKVGFYLDVYLPECCKWVLGVNTSSLLESSLFRGMCLWNCLPNWTWIFQSTHLYS